MPMTMSASIEITRPAADVFDYIANMELNPTYEQVASFLGRRIETSFVVTASEPDESITIESVKSTFPIKVTRTVEALGPNHCRASARIEGGPGGLLALLSPLMKPIAQRSVRGDYRRLKALLEESRASQP